MRLMQPFGTGVREQSLPRAEHAGLLKLYDLTFGGGSPSASDPSAQSDLAFLLRYVPTRFLAPWFCE